MKTNRRLLGWTLLCVACLSTTLPSPAAESPRPQGRNASGPRPYPERLRWWGEGRFGIFVHWGPVSLKGTEISWSRANTNPKCPNHGEIPASVYDGLYRDFNPTNFDAGQWANLAQAAGAKYLVLTAKHCDGFLLWHSRVSDHNIAATPFRRDVCSELADAARARGLKLGWYFSPMDWRDPDFRTERNAAFLGRMQGELRELLGNYGKIDLLWFDWDGREPLYDQARTYEIVKSLQPWTVINNRLDLAATNTDRQILSPFAEYYTPEQNVGAYDDQRPWESCLTTSRRGQWAWGGTADGVKSLDACLEMLIRCAGGDGNVLLNVGPTPTGEIAPEQAGLLRRIGAWLKENGESIYGTRGGPFKPGDYGVSTRKDRTIYLHVLEWLGNSVTLPPLAARVVRARVLNGGEVAVRQTENALEMAVPPEHRKPLDTILALDLDRDALDLPAVDVPAPASLAARAKATASNIYQNQAQYGPDKAVDGDRETRWATDSGTKTAWLEVDLGRPTRFRRAAVRQAFPELGRVRKFQIEYWRDGQWRVCRRGEEMGAKWSAEFAPLTAQRVRLNLVETTDGPTIWEFLLYP